jgi:hypothetical protein
VSYDFSPTPSCESGHMRRISPSSRQFFVSSGPLRLLFALALGGALSGCSGDARTQAMSRGIADAAPLDIRTMIDDRSTGLALNQFRYTGHWESVAGRLDGRSLGTSTRSFHASDLASISFRGAQIRLYGIVGPKGGDALITVDGRDPRLVTFHGPRVSPGALVYTSPSLEPAVHTLTIFVTGKDGARRRPGFVNVDSAVVSTLASGDG